MVYSLQQSIYIHKKCALQMIQLEFLETFFMAVMSFWFEENRFYSDTKLKKYLRVLDLCF